MSRRPRKESPTGYYHVVQRGTGKQVLFEDEYDYERYMTKLTECKSELCFNLCAYCLMNNHVHLLIHVDSLKTLSKLMLRLGRSYAGYYNVKYDHAGYVFQDRFYSDPIYDDQQLLTCVRYIHNNPVKAGLGQRDDYRWSSYNDYFSNDLDGYRLCGRNERQVQHNTDVVKNRLVDFNLVLGLFDSIEQFKQYSESADDEVFVDVEVDVATCSLGQEIIRKHFGNEFENSLMVKQLRVEERNQIIREMKQAGMNNHQIELVTGVSRRIVSRVPG